MLRKLFISVLFLTGVMAAAPASDLPPAPWDILHHAVVDSNVSHRRQALNALGSMGASNAEAVRLVENALKNDKDSLVRQTAAAVLGEMKARQAVPALEEALDDKTGVAFSAAKALVDIGEAAPARGLLTAVLAGERTDSPSITQKVLQNAKQRLEHPQQLALMGVNEASGALLGPGAMGVVAAEEAIKMEDPFKDKGAVGRALAATYLAKDNDPYALTLLEWALVDSNWGVRAAAARGVGERGNAASIAKLEPLLNDNHNGVRTMAAAAIIRLQAHERMPSPESADRAQ